MGKYYLKDLQQTLWIFDLRKKIHFYSRIKTFSLNQDNHWKKKKNELNKDQLFDNQMITEMEFQ